MLERLNELESRTASVDNKPFASYIPQLENMADYFLETLPSNLNDILVINFEVTINQLFLRSYRESWSPDLQEALLETLSRVGELSYIIKKRPSSEERSNEFFKTAKLVGRLLKILPIYHNTTL